MYLVLWNVYSEINISYLIISYCELSGLIRILGDLKKYIRSLNRQCYREQLISQHEIIK